MIFLQFLMTSVKQQ